MKSPAAFGSVVMAPLFLWVIHGDLGDPLVDDELGGGSPKLAAILAHDFVQESGVPLLHSLHYTIQRSRVA